MNTITIDLKPHLSEYIRMKYSWPHRAEVVLVPWRSELYQLMVDRVAKSPRPKAAYVNTGNTTFRLPNQPYGKQSKTYDWMSQESVKIIERWIEVMMWSEFHQFVENRIHIHHYPLNRSVYFFISMYGITSLSEDAFIKNYQRWRNRNVAHRKTYKKSNKPLKTVK